MLKRQNRLRRRSDFTKVHKSGKVKHAEAFTIKYRQNNLPHNRVAVVVSTKVSKKAVLRNRTRRRFYSQLQDLWPKITTGYDIIILTRHQALDLSTDEINKQLSSCFQRAGILN